MRTICLYVLLFIVGCAAPPAGERARAGAPAVAERDAPLRVVIRDDQHVTYLNTSARPIWVYGYTPDQPLYQLETFAADQGEWNPYPIGWCGTGAARHQIAPGETHEFNLAHNMRGKLWRVSLFYYTSPSSNEWRLAPSTARGG